MKTARTLFYLLVATNIVLAVMLALPQLGVQLPLPWAPTGDSKRLTMQLKPDSIRILGNAPAANTAASPPAQPAAPAQTATTQADANAVVCVAVRGLSLEDSRQLTDQATRQNEGLAVQVSGLGTPSYWVNIPPNGGKDGATRRAEVLTRAGIEDYIIVRDAGPNQYAISLALLHNEDAANRLIETLRKKNIKSARISVRDNTGNNARAELTGRSGPLETLLTGFLGDHKGVQRESCASR